MKAFRALLLVLAALMLCSAASGIQRLKLSSSDGLQVFHFGSIATRTIAGILGLVLFAVAARGISMRLWYVGAAMLLLSAMAFFVQGIIVSVSATDTFTCVWALVSQAAASLIVLILVFRWWLPKRKEMAKI